MDRAGWILTYLCLLAVAAGSQACSGPDVGVEPDADLTIDIDGSELADGVALHFLLSPQVDVQSAIGSAGFTLGESHIDLTNLRLIGDAATGDGRTSLELARLKWDKEHPFKHSVSFPDAPPGLYSTMRASVKQFEFKIAIDPDDGEPFVLELEYESPIAIEVALDSMLDPGGVLELGVGIDMASVLATIDISSLVVVGGEAKIDPDSETMDALIDVLSQSFSIESSIQSQRP